MNSIHKILYHSLSAPFYRQIAGGLLFLFFLLFGIQQNLQTALLFHYFIIKFFIENSAGILMLAVINLAFTIKCISFFSNCAHKEAYSFTGVLNGYTFKKRFMHLLWVAIVFLAPILIYNLIVVIIALQSKNFTGAGLVIFLTIVIILITNLRFIKLLKYPGNIHIRRYSILHAIHVPKTLSWFLLSFMFRKQFKALILVKFLSFFSLYYFGLNDSTVFEERMLWLIFLLCVIAHSIIIYKNFYFLENEMSYYRNMPLRNHQVIISIFLSYALICLPEMWALRGLGFMHHNWYSYICIFISMPALLTLLHVLLYTDDFSLEAYLPIIFGIWMLFLFFSLSENKWIVPAIAMAGSIIVFLTSFRSFEKKSEVAKLE